MLARLFKTCLSATIVVSLTASFFPALFAQASTDDVRWSPVSLPAEGIAGGWALAAGADTRYLTAAIDGTLYCYATPAGTTDRLFKSMNGGLSWSSTGRVKDAMAAGNVYDALPRVEAVGSQQEWYHTMCSPAVKIASLSIVAGQ